MAPYAQYFVKFIEAYRSLGIPIWAVTAQNEPVDGTFTALARPRRAASSGRTWDLPWPRPGWGT